MPNLHAAAQTVIGDWRDGRVQGWVQAPKLSDETVNSGRAADQKQIVTTWAKEFKIEGLWGDEGGDQDDGLQTDVAMSV